MSTKTIGDWADALMECPLRAAELAEIAMLCDIDEPVEKDVRDWCSYSEMCDRLGVSELSLSSGIVESGKGVSAHWLRLAEGYTWETARVAMVLVVNAARTQP